ncbi:hypothetical protein [Acinetobacter sp. ESBL14]|uniref:hypothetical protein n=1 Tax=Acinetobacter sp. ESBL14 TaxID=3077329 RepID=UPI002FC9DF01
MFKVGDKTLTIDPWFGNDLLTIVEFRRSGSTDYAIFSDGGFFRTSALRHANPEEIQLGHRIDKTPLMQHLDKCEEVVKTWPKWKKESIRDAFGIPGLEALRDCDTSPNCKKYER